MPLSWTERFPIERPLGLNWESEAGFDTIHYYHGLKTLDIRVFIEKTAGEPFVAFHVFCRHDKYEVCLSSHVVTEHNLTGTAYCGFETIDNASPFSLE